MRAADKTAMIKTPRTITVPRVCQQEPIGTIPETSELANVVVLPSMAVADSDLDRLLGLPLEDFTRARNDLAKRLKSEGNTEAADEIRALPKPSVPVWTINQLARVDHAGVKALLEAAEALRRAQQRLLRGDEAGDTLRDATAREREAVERLTERARGLVAESGRPATAATLDRIGATLRAAVVTEEGRTLLETGRLTTELEPAGFGAFAPGDVPAAPRRRSERGRREQEQRQRKELKEKARAAEQAARAAEREADRAEAAAREARQVAEKARAEADAARERERGTGL
jgi:hypothetical protein